MNHRPNCCKMGCNHISDVILSLPKFGLMYFCASHALLNLQWQSAIEMSY